MAIQQALTSIRFDSPTITIFDNEDTIPVTTKIIGADPSTAKDYATKYNRPFELIVKQLKGDVSGDNIVNVLDVVKTVNIVLGKIQPTSDELYSADANNDGIVNVLDVVRIVNIVLDKK